MAQMLTVREAARLVGTDRSVVKAAITRGELPATRASHPNGPRWKWMVAAADVEEWASTRQTKNQWSDADVAALAELYTSCQNAQIARYLGRNQFSVENKIKNMVASGELERVRHRQLIPFRMPRGALLVAQTCIGCGRLRSARFFTRAEGYYHKSCFSCANKKVPPAAKNALRNAQQKITVGRAHRHGTEWTDWEDELLRDVSKSSFQLALDLGRSMVAVHSRRYKDLKVRLKPDREYPGEWLIDFTPQNQVEREIFRSLGVVPESEWDWNDGEVA